MKKYIFSAVIAVGIFISPVFSYAAIYGGNYPDSTSTITVNVNGLNIGWRIASSTQSSGNSIIGFVTDGVHGARWDDGNGGSTALGLVEGSGYQNTGYGCWFTNRNNLLWISSTTDQWGHGVSFYQVGTPSAVDGTCTGATWAGFDTTHYMTWDVPIVTADAQTSSGDVGTSTQMIYALGDSTSSVFAALNTSGPTPPSLSLSFEFPVDGTTTIPFTNWILHTGGYGSLPPLTPFFIGVQYGGTSTQMFFTSVLATNSSDPNSLPSPTIGQLLPFVSSSSDYYAQAFISSDLDIAGRPTGTIYKQTSVIHFTMVASTTFIQSGGGLNFLTPLVSSSTQGTCQSGNLIGDGLCIFLVGALTPQQSAVSFLQSGENAFVSAPPFGQVLGTLGALRNAVSSSPPGQDLDVYFSFGSVSGTIPFLTSSTMNEAVTPAGKTVLFQLEDEMFYLLDLAAIFFVPWHWWRKKHSAQSTQK